MKKFIPLLLMLFLLLSCDARDPKYVIEMYSLKTKSVAVGESVWIKWSGVDCQSTGSNYPTEVAHSGSFVGLRALNGYRYNFTSQLPINVKAYSYAPDEVEFIVPAKSVSGNFTLYVGRGGSLGTVHILYPEALTMSSTTLSVGSKVTVTSIKSFFDIESFSTAKVKLLLDAGYPPVWINGNSHGDVKANGDGLYPIVGSDLYDIDEITPYRISFTIPSWAKSGKIQIRNESGYIVPYYDLTPLQYVKITVSDFSDLLSKISLEDQTLLESNYHLVSDLYVLNDDIPDDPNDEVYKNIKRVLKQSGYYNTHVVNIAADPNDPNGYFTTAEELKINE